MFGRRPRVKCFNAAYSAGAYAARADLGYRLVPVERIVGSVGRCQELDQAFQPLTQTQARRERLERIRRLVEKGIILPPVELYKLKDEYFVVDGNHRVAVAKENGQVEIDAHVIEMLPDGQRAEDRLYLERQAFARETGLEEIALTQLGGYERLRQEIEAHRQGMSAADGRSLELATAAGHWHATAYLPLIREIASRRLPRRARRSAADLYLDLQALRAQQGLSPEQALARLEMLFPQPNLRERLGATWRDLPGRLRAWWQGLREDDLPCAYAGQAADGTIYCRRATRLIREERRDP